MAAFSNPGIAQPVYDELEAAGMNRYCKECEIYQKTGTEHCDDCGVCIDDYDHHCPWTSKCIGKGNLMWFYCFLIGLSM